LQARVRAAVADGAARVPTLRRGSRRAEKKPVTLSMLGDGMDAIME